MRYPLEEEFIRRLSLAACLVVVIAAAPERSSAAPSLALRAGVYPHHTKIVVLPATDAAADHYFGLVHHSSYEHLHRIDGSGWLQAGLWAFKTGRGGAKRTHKTVFTYTIGIFPSGKVARHALWDVKLKTRKWAVDRIYARRYTAHDGRQTLTCLFFAYHEVLVETYFEYHGTAPKSVALTLHRSFHHQALALARIARHLHKAIHSAPATATAPPETATATATAFPTDTPTAIPTAVPTQTAIIPTATPSPTATATPSPLTLTAAPNSTTVSPGSAVTVTATLTLDDQPVVGASTSTTFRFIGAPVICLGETDEHGQSSCTGNVPGNTRNGTTITVDVTAQTPGGQTAETETTFTVKG